MIYLLSGPPGAGKGTQSDMLVRRMQFKKLSTGDALRAAAQAGTPVGRQGEMFMARGELVPDPVLFAIVKAALQDFGSIRVVLDGYPRTRQQAHDLASLQDEFPVAMFILLRIGDKEIVARVTGRRVCPRCQAVYHLQNHPPQQIDVCDRCGTDLEQRSDDMVEKLARRLQVYRAETEPLVDFYAPRKLLREIDAAQTEEKVFVRLQALIAEGSDDA